MLWDHSKPFPPDPNAPPPASDRAAGFSCLAGETRTEAAQNAEPLECERAQARGRRRGASPHRLRSVAGVPEPAMSLGTTSLASARIDIPPGRPRTRTQSHRKPHRRSVRRGTPRGLIMLAETNRPPTGPPKRKEHR